MKKALALLLLIGLLGYGLYDSLIATKGDKQTKSQENGEVGLEIGNIAPDFTLKTLEGDTVSLSDYRGKKVIVNIWATWCPPCRAEMPDMQDFYEQSGDDIEILAVNSTLSEKNRNNVENFVQEYGLTFPILLDEKNEVNRDYAIVSIPSSFYIDTSGRIQHKFVGAMSFDQMNKLTKSLD